MSEHRTSDRQSLGAAYYWLKALWWFLLAVNFPFDMLAKVTGAADDFTFAPAYRIANMLYDRRKAGREVAAMNDRTENQRTGETWPVEQAPPPPTPYVPYSQPGTV